MHSEINIWFSSCLSLSKLLERTVIHKDSIRLLTVLPFSLSIDSTMELKLFFVHILKGLPGHSILLNTFHRWFGITEKTRFPIVYRLFSQSNPILMKCSSEFVLGPVLFTLYPGFTFQKNATTVHDKDSQVEFLFTFV